VWLIAFNNVNQSNPYRISRFNPGAHPASLKDAFGITTPGAAGVRETFEAIHEYLQTPGLDVENEGTPNMTLGGIGYGDWIDLDDPDGLTVAKYPSDTVRLGELNHSKINLTLIVVGINSFAPEERQYGKYPGGGSGSDKPHLVFQFKDIPVDYYMNNGWTNTGGYKGSLARSYLVEVEDKDGSGAFMVGLTAAGVPFDDKELIWAPTRYTSNNNDETTDQLWLPTEYEMTGKQIYSSYDENWTNQGRLGYYMDDTDDWENSKRRVKKGGDNYAKHYWLVDLTPSGRHKDKRLI
jgi:hypothetical protein